MIPYSTQDIREADIRAVVTTLRSGWLTQGPAVEQFEKALAKAAGTKYAVAVNSGTAALHAAYFAAGIKKGDEVLVMFAGVAPFSIVIAKNSRAKKVFSVEINKEATKYAKQNVELNKLKDKVEIIQGDVKKFAEKHVNRLKGK